MKPFFASSIVNLLVIFSSSSSLYILGSMRTPALPPPNGTSTTAHLYVIKAASALTSPSLTSGLNLTPSNTEKIQLTAQYSYL